MTVASMLNKIIGVDDIKQSVAWIGSVGLCIGLVGAFYVRLGQFVEAEAIRDVAEAEYDLQERQDIAELKAMIEPWNETGDDGTIVYPADTIREIRELQEQVKQLHLEMADRTRDRVFKSEIKPEALVD